MLYMNKRFTILKGLTRSVVDFCVLPGTSNGAEILWIYTMQWKNRTSLVLIGLLSFVYSNMHMVIEDHLSGKSVNGPENTR
jgi:hypothetical protein